MFWYFENIAIFNLCLYNKYEQIEIWVSIKLVKLALKNLDYDSSNLQLSLTSNAISDF